MGSKFAISPIRSETVLWTFPAFSWPSSWTTAGIIRVRSSLRSLSNGPIWIFSRGGAFRKGGGKSVWRGTMGPRKRAGESGGGEKSGDRGGGAHLKKKT